MNTVAIKSAFKHLKKNLRFSLFNTFGLTLGFLSFFFISIFVIDELRYDSYNKNRENIFRLESHLKLGDDVSDYATAPPVIGANITNTIPGIVASCRLYSEKGNRFELSNELIVEDNLFYSDPSIFKVFTLPFVKGNAESALGEANQIVLTEKSAMKYFNTTSVIGNTMRLYKDDTVFNFKIIGVIKDIPAQSHFKADFLISMENLPISKNSNYLSFYPFSTYILKNASSDKKTIEHKVNNWIESSIPDYKEIEKGGNQVKIILTPLKDIHLKSDKKYELSKNGNIQYIYIFSLAAIFILCMAGINFMNLSLARFTKRSKEVAVKKVLGSSSTILSLQFLFESIILCLVSTILATLIGWCLISYFNNISNKSMTFIDILNSWTVPFLLLISILLGIISGSYPAIVFSSLNATSILGGKSFLNTSRASFSLRNILLVSQFIVSTFLITGTIIIYKQLRFIHEKDNGYDKKQIIIVKNASVLSSPEILKQKVLNLSGVVSATFSSFLPTNNVRWSNFGGISSKTNPIQTEFWPIDEDYIPTLGIKIIKGRNFDKLRLTDSTAVILNEAANKAFALGDKISSNPISFSYRQQQRSFQVVGVVKDFHFSSLRQNIAPLVFILADNHEASLIIKCTKASDEIVTKLNESWNSLSPKEKINISFMDDDFKTIYKEDDLMGKLFLIFSTLSIIIACLGLFGLVNYNVAVRKKEIAIRKALGASRGSVAALLSKKYLLLVLTSIGLATPLAWLLTTEWLQQFAYRYNASYMDFAIAALLSIFISVVTLSSKLMTLDRKILLDNLKSA